MLKHLLTLTVLKPAQKFLNSGGGQPFFATAGGSDAAGLKEAVEGVKGYV